MNNDNILPVNTDQVIAYLQLSPHPEGGYFRRSYTSGVNIVDENASSRPAMSSIFYLLTADQALGRMHRNRSDIVHYYQGGGALRYTLIGPQGQVEEHTMGSDLAAGQLLQLTVAGNWWKASELLDGDYGLISEAVCPGFDYQDHQFAGAEQAAQFPQYAHLMTIEPSS